jgi:hypothetical protein
VEIYPTKDVKAETAATHLLSFIGRYGVPDYIQHDGGRQFVNDMLGNLSLLCGYQPIKTIAYSHEENGLVERVNKEILRHLRAILHDYSLSNEWSSALPFVMRIINSRKHSSLGVSPAQILFGNAIDLDEGIILPLKEVEGNLPLSQNVSDYYMKNMIEQQNLILQIAEKHLEETKAKKDLQFQKNHPNQNFNEEGKIDKIANPVYQIDDFVLLAWPNSGHHSGPPDKRKLNLRGPYKVVECFENHLKIQSLVNNQCYKYHKSLFIPFLYDPEITNPFKEACKDLVTIQ